MCAIPSIRLPPHLRGDGKDDSPTWDHFGGSWGKRRRTGTPASPKFYIGDVVRSGPVRVNVCIPHDVCVAAGMLSGSTVVW